MALLIGAYDPKAWAGLVFSDAPGRGFGLRFVVEREGERLDGYDLQELVQDVGPCAPDGSYSRVGFDVENNGSCGLRLEWSRIEETTAVLRVSVAYEGYFELRGYFPWDWKGQWRIEGDRLIGTTQDGASVLTVRGRDRIEPILDSECEAVVRVEARLGIELHVFAALDQDPLQRSRGLDVTDHFDKVSREYEARRAQVEGEWEGLASAVTNNLHWTVCLQPERQRLYTPAGRRWIFPAKEVEREHWTLFCWDSFFNALELGLEAPELAESALAAVLECQYPNGNIPNWRGRFAGTPDRSQPPIGSFAVLKLFLRSGDRLILERAFPYLERWSAWWRADKNGQPRRGGSEGLFSWGSDLDLVIDSPAPWESSSSDHQKAAWESGQDDLPNWDEAGWDEATETLDLDAVDLNSYLALDDECLSHIAAELGDKGKSRFYRKRYEDLVRRMNEVLWNEDRGLFVDRFRDGRFSGRLAASNFLPLLAGVPTQEQAERMLLTLCDPSLFWGKYIIPSISRDDAAYNDQQYWRGSIWPPTNYLIHAGLRRYCFDETASELAGRNVDLFLPLWREHGYSHENYDSRSGEGGGHRHQSWGPLLALLGIESFIDITPWEGLRIGSWPSAGESTLKRLRWLGHEWTISVSKKGLTVHRDGSRLLSSRGAVVLRGVEIEENRFSAETHSPGSVELGLWMEPPLSVTLDGAWYVSETERIHLPAGEHWLTVSEGGSAA